MTVTAFATGDALTEKVWIEKALDLGMDRSYFAQNGYVGEDENNIIIKVTDLARKKGDTATIGAIGELTGSGVSGDGIMEGNEELLPTYDDNITLDQIRNAVRIEGAMTEQRTSIALRQKASNALGNWLANKITQDTFDGLTLSPNRVVYGGDATSRATIEASDYFTSTLIKKCTTIAGKVTPEIKPVTKAGMEVFVMTIADDCGYDLAVSDSVYNQAMREAMPRGADNPIFKNAYAKMHDTIIQKHKYITTSATFGSASTIAGAENLFMGKGAGAWLFAKDKFWKEKTFDYDNSPGVCVGAIFGVGKLVFNSKDNAVIVVVTSRTNNASVAYA